MEQQQKLMEYRAQGTISRQSEWLQSKSLQAINAGEGVERRELSCTVGGFSLMSSSLSLSEVLLSQTCFPVLSDVTLQ